MWYLQQTYLYLSTILPVMFIHLLVQSVFQFAYEGQGPLPLNTGIFGVLESSLDYLCRLLIYCGVQNCYDVAIILSNWGNSIIGTPTKD